MREITFFTEKDVIVRPENIFLRIDIFFQFEIFQKHRRYVSSIKATWQKVP